MNPGTSFDALLDVFSDLIAAKVGARLSGREGGREGGKVQKRLLSVEEGAEYLGRTKEAVQHMIAAGKLPIVKSDRRVFLDVRDLDAWIERSKVQ
jgi:excisionase family DNA binding protein